MHVTFFLGNGFDLNLGLETRYIDFYPSYINEPSSNNVIAKFKEILKGNSEIFWHYWSDFELGMGKYSEHFADPKEFRVCYNDFVKSFNQYLLEKCREIDWGSVDLDYCNRFAESICRYYKFISEPSMQEKVKNLTGNNAKAYFLQFNYTDVLDKLLNKIDISNLLANGDKGICSIGGAFHIHGKIEDGLLKNGYLTLGVHDETQIANEEMRKDPGVQKTFIKPHLQDLLQELQPDALTPRNSGLRLIEDSSVICIFGASIGATDIFWWKKIGEWLLHNEDSILVIFDIHDDKRDGVGLEELLTSIEAAASKERDILNRFLSFSGLGDAWYIHNPKRISISLNSKMFKLSDDPKLPKIPSQ